MRVLLLLGLWHVSVGFISESPASRASRALLSGSTNRWTKVYARPWKTKEKKETVLVEEQEPINGEPRHHAMNVPQVANVTLNATSGEQINTAEDVVRLMEEFNKYIEDGSKEMFANFTEVMEEKLELVRLPDDAAQEMSSYLMDMTLAVQKTQQREIERYLKDIEAQFVRPIEDLAFSDAALFNKETETKKKKTPPDEDKRNKLILTGENSTLQESSRSMRTIEIIRNLNVAPFYYSITLLNRWLRHLSYPPMYVMSSLRGMASLIKWPSPTPKKKGEESYAEYIKNAELMQAGWKRTGEIAAKGPLARKWAILRRSAEIWAYFSSFYIKERRMTNKYNSGRWSKEKYSEERSKLGKEVTQNLLKLGPTFIKVRSIDHLRNSCIHGIQHFISFRFSFCFYRLASCFPRGSILCRKNTSISSSCCRTKYRPFLATSPCQ